jgi:hypothetical protein
MDSGLSGINPKPVNVDFVSAGFPPKSDHAFMIFSE